MSLIIREWQEYCNFEKSVKLCVCSAHQNWNQARILNNNCNESFENLAEFKFLGVSIGVHLVLILVSNMDIKFVKLNSTHRLIHVLCFQRPIMYGFMIGGWTVGIYFFQLVWENLRLIIKQYQHHVLSYVVFTGILSFIVCYRLGPVTDERSKNLIKWALQVLKFVGNLMK
jgi:hypothetical protein